MASLRIQRQQGLQRRVRFRQSLWQRCRMPLKCFTTTSSLENSVVSLENQVYLPTPIQPWLKRDYVLNNWKLILRPLTGIISGVSLAWSIKFKSQNFLWKNNHGHDQILIILLAFTFELFLLVGFSKKKKKNGITGYIGESCDKGNWCFKKDVGNTLPQNFLVYNGQPINQETATADLRTLIAKLVSPDMTKKTVVGTVVPPPGSIRQRRIESRSLRRRQGPQLSINHNSTDSSRLSPSSGMPVSNDTVPHSLLVIDSYADGFEVAKKFALEGFSQLGFVDQYLSRRLMLIKSGSIITQMGNQTLSDDDDASDYSVWFLRGLKDGQNMITKTIQAGPGNKIVRRRATGSKVAPTYLWPLQEINDGR